MTTTETTLLKHLSNFLDEFEIQFDNDGISWTSEEFAEDYIEAAKFARKLGRTSDRIKEVQEVLDEKAFDRWDGGYEGDGKFADNH